MARMESVALGGYVATPVRVIPLILDRLVVESGSTVSACDPCAGNGEMLAPLAEHLAGEGRTRRGVYAYACEMETGRAKALEVAVGTGRMGTVLKGDAFRARFEGAVDVLYLNPPYHVDREHGRLEHRFLVRFAAMVRRKGILVLVVPHYALAPSAALLAQGFEDIGCYRFPAGEYEAYRQVVLFAQRREDDLLAPDGRTLRKIEAWSEDASGLLPLDNGDRMKWLIRGKDHAWGAPLTWEMGQVDVGAVSRAYRLWQRTTRLGVMETVPGVLPEALLSARSYPVAMPPRPAHLAAAIASGLFNGELVRPDEPGRPALLVKGVFDREFVAVDERKNKEGEKTGEIQVQQPRLVVTALDLDTCTYSTLEASPETTGSRSAAGMSTGDLIVHYSRDLAAVMRRQCPVLHDPQRAEDQFPLPTMKRTLYRAQADIVRASVRLLGGVHAKRADRRQKAAIVLGEIGAGKTGCALAVAQTIGTRRMLVMCPPHLLKTWADQVAMVLGSDVAAVTLIQDVTDLETYAADTLPRLHVAVLSRETAKLGHGYGPIGPRCPSCGASVPEDAVKKRLRCAATYRKAVDTTGQLARVLARGVAQVAPTDANVVALLDRRLDVRLLALLGGERTIEQQAHAAAAARRRGWRVIARLVARLERTTELVESTATAIVDIVTRLLLGVWQSDAHGEILAMLARMWRVSLRDPRRYGGGDALRTQLRPLVFLAGSTPADRMGAIVALERIGPYENAWSVADDEGARMRIFESSLRAFERGEDVVTPGEPTWHHWKLEGGVLHVDKEPAGALAFWLRSALSKLTARAKWQITKPCDEALFQAIPEPRRIALAPYICKRYPKLFDLFVADECFVAGTMVSERAIETIRVGDTIDSYDETSGRHVQRRVTRLWVRPAMALVRVTFSNGSAFVCTPNHPVFTAQGWVNAAALTCAHEVVTLGNNSANVVRGMPDLWQGDHEAGCGGKGTTSRGIRILRRALLRTVQESKASGASLGGSLCCAGMRGGNDQGWQVRDARDQAGVCVLLKPMRGSYIKEASSVGLGGTMQPLRGKVSAHPQSRFASTKDWGGLLRGGVSPYGQECQGECGWQAGDGKEPRRDCRADAYPQSHVGSGDSGAIWRDLSRPTISWQAWRKRPTERTTETAVGGTGVAQGGSLGRARVESVEVLERGGDGRFGSVCPDGLVYNLEVEGTHTYFAGGVLVHNCHELSAEGSAQALAAQRLAMLGMPLLFLTGSIMNGYAESMFNILSMSAPAFRAEFSREDRASFVDRYGYRKAMVEYRDKDSGKVVEFGAVSDRVERTIKMTGNAPGVLPLLLLRHLLPHAVTLHKTDLAIDIPLCTEEVVMVDPSPEQMAGYTTLLAALKLAIRRDRFTPLAGRLWGAMADMPSYLDRCTADVGNRADGSFEIAYPPAAGGAIVAHEEGMAAGDPLPKETWLLSRVQSDLAEGRNVLVYGWHTELLPRLVRLLGEAFGDVVAHLEADRVQAGKREAWIDKNVLAKKTRILVVNPVCVQTGLNNLVWFSTAIWHQNPGCNPQVYRQANGRIDRIGQKLPTRIVIPVYRGTAQEQAHKLLLHKVAVGLATDGLDAESALQAAGVGHDATTGGMALGRQLYRMVSGEDD